MRIPIAVQINPFDVENAQPQIDAIREFFTQYLEQVPRKSTRSKHGLMGPVGKILSEVKSGRRDPGSLKGFAVRVHEATGRGPSPEALAALELGIDQLVATLREALDYTVLRTEETRELNSASTPLSESDRATAAKRVAFLGSKQKAAESRQMEYLLRSATTQAGKAVKECYLKDNLCLECPRCGLHGGSALGEAANIKHRIEYSTAFSLLPFEQISDEITFNAVNETDQKTGQALGSRHVVKPATLFPSIVTLKAVTWEELVLAVKMLLACKSYGAESRIGGDCRNTLFGVAAGWEEIITPLELTLELYDQKDSLDASALKKLLDGKYKALAGNPDRVRVLEPGDVDALAKECADTPLDQRFLDKAYNDVADYRKAQSGKK